MHQRRNCFDRLHKIFPGPIYFPMFLILEDIYVGHDFERSLVRVVFLQPQAFEDLRRDPRHCNCQECPITN
jgi:hypothetical protein